VNGKIGDSASTASKGERERKEVLATYVLALAEEKKKKEKKRRLLVNPRGEQKKAVGERKKKVGTPDLGGGIHAFDRESTHLGRKEKREGSTTSTEGEGGGKGTLLAHEEKKNGSLESVSSIPSKKERKKERRENSPLHFSFREKKKEEKNQLTR